MCPNVFRAICIKKVHLPISTSDRVESTDILQLMLRRVKVHLLGLSCPHLPHPLSALLSLSQHFSLSFQPLLLLGIVRFAQIWGRLPRYFASFSGFESQALPFLTGAAENASDNLHATKTKFERT